MPRQRGYERFGLVKNPFQDITGEQLEEVGLLHVNQPIDEVLQSIRDDVLDRRRKAAVALVGAMGTGKTQRLMVAKSEFEEAGGVAVYHQMTHEARWIVGGVAEATREAVDLGAIQRFVSSPKWYRDLLSLEKQVRKKYDPERVGRVLAEALNANAPAALLLNDLQNMEGQKEVDLFMQTLHAVMNHIRPGVLVMLSSYPRFFQQVSRRHGAVLERLDRRLPVKGLSENEAALMIAKRFLANRLVDDLDPLYPFTQEAIRVMARASRDNPRRLLKLANRVLEAAIGTKAYHVDDEMVKTTLADMGSEAEVRGSPRRAANGKAGSGGGRAPGQGTGKPPARRPAGSPGAGGSPKRGPPAQGTPPRKPPARTST